MNSTIHAFLNDLTYIGHKELFEGQPINAIVYAKYVEYVESGQYPYIDAVAEWIKKTIPELNDISEEQYSRLKSHVYYSANKRRELKKKEYRDNLIAQGWNILSPETVKEAIVHGRRLVVRYTTDSVFGGPSEQEKVFKPIEDKGRGRLFLMPPKARTKGYLLETFYDYNAMCMEVSK